jgi:hypothetical protein
MVVVA